MKKIVSLLLAVVMLMSMTVWTSAETTVIEDEILHSITEEDNDNGLGLAFAIKVNAKGVGVNGINIFDNTNATVQHEGETVKLVKMGVVLTNNSSIGAQPELLTIDNANGSNIINIEGVRLYEAKEDYCRFIARVTRIPARYRGTIIFARPYYVIEKDGADVPVYADETDNSSYLNVWGQLQGGAELPAEGTDADVHGQKGRITLDASYSYKLDENRESELLNVNFTFKNVAPNAINGADDWVEYTCYDLFGDAIKTDRITLGSIQVNGEKSFSVDLSVDTAKIELTDSSITYTPVVTLPAIGSDIDVSKKKNRIRVSAATAAFNEDNTIAVRLTFKNYTTNWITEETDYVKYTCYGADGRSIKTATLYIGCIDTKKTPVKTFNFDVPVGTCRVAITSSKIVYWTEWA